MAHKHILAISSTCSSFLLDQDLTFYPFKAPFQLREMLSELWAKKEINMDPDFWPDTGTM